MKRKKTSIRILLFCAFCICFAGAPSFCAEKTASSFFDEGLSAQNDENWYAASQHFLEAVQTNPVYADAWFHLAQCSYQLGEFELVLTQLDEAEKYAKDDTALQNLRGMTYIALGKFSEARTIFEHILKKMPNNVDARFGLAELDLFDGRISGAEKQYGEALKRQNENRKALLSLAVVSAQLGKAENARHYISQAIGYYSGEAEVHYLAAVVSAMQGNLTGAEKQCRVAVELNGNYDRAYELLSKVRFAQNEYEEVISICDFRIARDRNRGSAWYLKGAAEKELGRTAQAVNTWSSGLSVVPDDEIMRAALEVEVNKSVPLEDSRRTEWAQYHIQQARECTRRYDKTGALYEYQRALKIEPSNEEARLAYADMLELNGMHELYLEQLLFIRQTRDSADVQDENLNVSRREVQMNDTIEAYDNLLQDSLSHKWNVQPFYLDKTRWNIGIYYVPSAVNQIHIQNNTVAAEFASDIFTGIASASVLAHPEQVEGFGDAYQKARTRGMDYFVILSLDEGSRDVTLSYTMYSGRTGNKITQNDLYGTANARYASVFRRFRQEILEHLPVRAKIIGREGKTLLADIGRSENCTEGAVFDVVRKNAVQTSSTGGGVSYKDDDILGSFTVTVAGEEISEGLLEYRGFYDRVNVGDELVLIKMPVRDEDNALLPGETMQGSPAVDTAPLADANGESVSRKKMSLTAEDLGIRRTPSFIDLIRSIY